MLIADKISNMLNGIHLFTPKNKKHGHRKRNGETTVIMNAQISAKKRDWATRYPIIKSPIQHILRKNKLYDKNYNTLSAAAACS